MKRNYLIILICLVNINLYAQKVDIDNFTIPVKYCNLPTNYVEPANRTFNISGTNTDDIKIFGWKKTTDNPNIFIKVNQNTFQQGEGKLDVRKQENKDKNGKVTSTTTTYAINVVNSGSGSISIYGPPINAFQKKPKRESEKAKAKREAAEEKKKSDNPFLKNVENTETTSDEGEPQNKPRVYFTFLNESYSHSTSYVKSSSTAWNTYNSSKGGVYSEHRQQFNKYVKDQTNFYVNNLYGYSPKKKNVKFKILNSKKHPEYENFQNAMNAAKLIFAKSAYNKSTEEITADLLPIIDYLGNLVTKYNADEKQAKRMKGSAIHNLAYIYYYIDNLEKAKEYAQMLIDTEYAKRDGANLIEDCDELAKLLAFHQMRSRHLIVEETAIAESEGEEGEEEEDEEEEEEEGGNK